MTTSEYPAVGITRLPRTIVEVTGGDRADFLHNLCTNDIKAMSPGDVREAFITNVQGKILGHVFVAAGKQSLILSTVAGQSEKLLAHLDRYLITEDVQLVDRSESHVQIAVSGAGATQLITQLTNVENRAIIVTSAPLTEPHGCLITCQQSNAEAIVNDLLARGAQELSLAGFERLRIEAGFPEYGIDFGEDNLPQEVDRNDQAISFTKGCYLGQETVARIDALGRVNRHLVGFRSDASSIATGDIVTDGKVIGRVTSAVFSPRLEAHIALGIVRREFSEPGTTIDINGQPVEVVALPFA